MLSHAKIKCLVKQDLDVSSTTDNWEPLDEEDNLEQLDYERMEDLPMPMWKFSTVDFLICMSDIVVA